MAKPLKSLPADTNFTKDKLAGIQGVMAKRHTFDPIEREYVEVEGEYKAEEHPWPRLLYHPEYNKHPMPDMAKFGAGANSVQEAELRNIAFNEAMHNYRRKQRVKVANNAKEFEALKKKGWLSEPPVHQDHKGVAFDYESDEI